MSKLRFTFFNDFNPLIKGNIYGIISALFYSITPLFIFFFLDNIFITIIYSILLIIWQEFISWIFIIVIYKYQKITFFLNKKYSLYWIIINFYIWIWIEIKFFFKFFLQKIKNKDIWILGIIGIISGPFSMILILLSEILLNKNATLSNILINTSPIYCLLITKSIFKEKISNFEIFSLFLIFFCIIGMIIQYSILESITTKKIIGIILAILTAILFAIEGLLSDYWMHNNMHIYQFNDQKIVLIKSFFSWTTMLFLILPLILTINYKLNIYDWQNIKLYINNFHKKILLILISSIIFAIGRFLFFKSINLTNSVYGLMTQFTMLLWTPILQWLFNKFFPKINIEIIKWYYWLWTILILFGLLLLIFNKQIYYLLKQYLKTK